MNELQELLNQEYKKEEGAPVTPQSLMEMVEEVMAGMEAISSTTTGYTVMREAPEETAGASDEVTVIRRPIIKITELWGKTDTGDRQIMETMMKKIEGGTVQAKIASVEEFIDAAAPAAGEGDISEIMSYLIFLDTFASIISDYGASVTGFLFEAFLAAIFGGTSIQVSDPEDVGASGSLPIEDNQIWSMLRKCPPGAEDCEDEFGVVPYSLKVLRQGGVVHGSYKNLVDFFLDPSPERHADSVTYLIVIKDAPELKGGKLGKWTGKLKFYEFTLTRSNFLEMIGAPTEIDIYAYVPVTLPRQLKQKIETTPAHIKGMPRFKITRRGTIKGTKLSGDAGTEVPAGTKVLQLKKTGETEDVIKGAAKKLYDPGKYKDIASELVGIEELEAEAQRQVFAALKDTIGYGAGSKGGAQWSITPKTYEQGFKGEIDLRPEVLKTKAIEYTKSLNASVVAIFNALGDMTENINKYFIGVEEGGNRKAAGVAAVQDAEILKTEVDKTIKGTRWPQQHRE